MAIENPQVPFHERANASVPSVGVEFKVLDNGREQLIFGAETLSTDPHDPQVLFTTLLVEAVDDDEVDYDPKLMPFAQQLWNKELPYKATIFRGMLDFSAAPGKINAHPAIKLEPQTLTVNDQEMIFNGTAANALAAAKSAYEHQESERKQAHEQAIQTGREFLDGEGLEILSSRDGEYTDQIGAEVENEEQLLWFTQEVLRRDGYQIDKLSADDLAHKQQKIREQIKRAQHQWENAIDEKTANFLGENREVPGTEKEVKIARQRAEDYVLNVLSKITGSLVTEVSDIGNAYYAAVLEDHSGIEKLLETHMKKDSTLDLRDALSDLMAYKIGSVGTNAESAPLVEEQPKERKIIAFGAGVTTNDSPEELDREDYDYNADEYYLDDGYNNDGPEYGSR